MSAEHLARGYVAGPGQGVPGSGSEVKASGRSTSGSLTVMEITVDQGPPRHTHTREDESLYLFTGTLEVECGEDRFQAGPESFVFLPRNLPHAFHSIGGPATGLLIVGPAGWTNTSPSCMQHCSRTPVHGRLRRSRCQRRARRRRG